MSMYNNFVSMPYIPYRIVEYLAYNNENLWKILKYNTYDCLSKDNLTFEEKMSLVWSHEANQEDYRIFFTALVENLIPTSETMIKIYKEIVIPKSTVNAVAGYEIDILYGGKISLIEYNGVPCNRGDVCEAEILSTLNGVEIGGVGRLEFNTRKLGSAKSMNNIGDNKSFTGNSLLLAVDISDIGDDESCISVKQIY